MPRACTELLWDLLPLAVVIGHLTAAPYTKVEESFNMQAAHDVLAHGLDLKAYDHQQFPGAVPRTFLGALATAAAAAPCAALGLPPRALLFAVRGALGFASVASLARLRWAVALVWGETEARCLALIVAFQFHLPFYMSRTLPNTFALILTNLAHAEAVTGSGYRCLAILGTAAAIFRCDLLVLIAPMGLMLLAQRQVKFFLAAAATAGAATIAACVSILIDSILWGRWLWPEFEVLWFNTGENKSSEWGTSPPAWYFYSALPRALLGAAPLAILGVVFERRSRGIAIVAIAFVALYSILPHKELRFIFPAIPLIDSVAAAGAARCFRWKGTLRVFAMLALGCVAVGTLFVTSVLTIVSVANYPGGVALTQLHASESTNAPLSVHIGNLAAMTGVSRFLEASPKWKYSKEEGLEPSELAARGFDRLLTEWHKVPGFSCQAVVPGFERIALRPRDLLHGRSPLDIMKVPKVYVLAKKSAREGNTEEACDERAAVWR